eukprot:gene601-748_t
MAVVENNNKDTNQWSSSNYISGGSIVKVKPIFIDSNTIIIANHDIIKVLHPLTGELKSEYKLDKKITSIVLSPNKKETVIYISTDDGELVRFDYKRCESLQTIKLLPTSITQLIVNQLNHNIVYFIDSYRIYSFDLSKLNKEEDNTKSTTTTVQPTILAQFKNSPYHIAIDQNANYLAANLLNNIAIVHLKNNCQIQSINSEFPITSLGFLPSQLQTKKSTTVIFGTTVGRLNLAVVSGSNQHIGITSYYHWHSTPLITLETSYDGTLLYTGAYEDSVAIWTIATMRRKILPRLGGAIFNIAAESNPSGQRLAICLESNKIQILQVSDQSLVQTISGMQFGRGGNRDFPAGIHQSPLYPDRLVLNGVSGSLQFFNPANNRVEMEIEVTPPKNTQISTDKTKGKLIQQIGYERNMFMIKDSDVSPISFHKSLPFLATFESYSSEQHVDNETVQNAKVTLKDQVLKIWECDTDHLKDGYQATFSVASPHKTNILSLDFHPTLPLLLTTSTRDFKVWKKQKVETVDGITNLSKSYWTCVYNGSYRDLSCQSGRFSPDGSIFSIACGHLISLWSTSDFSLLKILSIGVNPVVKCEFLTNSSQNSFIISHTKNNVCIWDLESCTPVKVYDFPISALSVGSSNYAFSTGDKILVFNNDTFQLQFEQILPVSISNMIFAKDAIYDCLYYTTAFDTIGQITTRPSSDQQKQVSTTSTTKKTKSTDISEETVVSNSNKRMKYLIGDAPTKKQKTSKDNDDTGKIVKLPKSKSLFNAASHIIPGVQNIYQSYMDSMLSTSNQSNNTNNNDENNNEQEQDSNSNQSNNNNDDDENEAMNIDNDNDKKQSKVSDKKNSKSKKKTEKKSTKKDNSITFSESMTEFFDNMENGGNEKKSADKKVEKVDKKQEKESDKVEKKEEPKETKKSSKKVVEPVEKVDKKQEKKSDKVEKKEETKETKKSTSSDQKKKSSKSTKKE